jgi:prepilin-type N-terminal cleavage/methylation domain-containing protein
MTVTTKRKLDQKGRSLRSGYSLIELVVVIAVSGVLVSLAMDSIGSARRVTSVRGAAENLIALGARARAMAIGRGVNATVMVDIVGDSAWLTQKGERLEVIHFATEFKVDVRGYQDVFRICMTPQGLADADCNSYTGIRNIVFANEWHAREVKLFPLGQMYLEK